MSRDHRKILIVAMFVLQINYFCACLKTKSELQFRSIITPNPIDMTLFREKLENITKKEFSDIPKGSFVTTATLPLKTRIIRENCPTVVLCVILCRKGKGSRTTFNRAFYKLCRRCKKESTKNGVQRENEILNYASRKLLKRATEVETMKHLVDHTEPSNEAKIGVNVSTASNTSLTTTTQSSILEFPDAPPGNLVKVLDLKLEEGYFRVFSDIVGYLQPASFPVDFLKDVLDNKIPIHILIFKAMKIEGQVLCWLFLWFILSLALPCAIIAETCCSKKGRQRLRDDYSITSNGHREKWMRKFNAFLMHLLLLLLLCSIALIITTNEQISQTASTAPNRIKIMFEDIETFVDNTQLQISSVTTSSMQIATEAVHKDLEDGERLLGNPLRQALNDETEIQTAILALPELTAVASDLSFRVASLIKDCNKARSVGKSLQESLTELSKLLTLTRQECLPRDRPLCDTLQTQTFTVTIYLDQLTSDYHLQQLEKMANNENFNRTIEISLRTFRGLPRRVSLETAASRTEIRSVLNQYRNDLFESVHSFEDIVNAFKNKIKMYKEEAEPLAKKVANGDLWRWILVLGLSVLTFLVWGFLICGAPCGCDSTPKTIPFLQTGLGLTCVLSLIMWTFGSVSFLIGGHCHVLICQPLYEDPSYITLNELLDTRDIISRSEDNLFYRILKANRSLRVDSIFNKCRNNQSAFRTFDLETIFNIEPLTNATQWLEYNEAIKRFPSILNNFQVLSPKLRENLEEFSSLSKVNFTKYRSNISQPITNKDLTSVAEQLKSVAKHLTDARSAENMERLAFRTEILIETELQRLKKIRDDILYQMVSLEVFLAPLNKRINQSLSRLKEIQYFVDNEGMRISRRVVSDYIDRLNKHLEQMYTFIRKKVFDDIGKCHPLWETFDMIRISGCNMMVDHLNGFSVACFFCILLFLALAPVTFTAIEQVRKDFEGSLDSITHRRAINGMLINEEGTWATPSPRSSSGGVRRHDLPPSEVPWSIAREHVNSRIPSAPRFPDHVSLPSEPSRIAEAFAKSSRLLDAAKLIRKPPQIREPSPDNASTTPARTEGVQSIASVSRILDSARSIQSHLRSPEPPLGITPSTSSLVASSQSLLMKTARRPEPSRNIKSPIPRIIQAMTSKARRRYESLKLIERIDRISPKSWL